MRHDILLALMLLPLLGACGGPGGGKVKSASQSVVRKPPPTTARRPAPAPPPRAQVLSLPGLEGVIGATAADLARTFGTARLDVHEGDARKLQFIGTPCVLDVYLYPPSAGKEPLATYLDARRASDGQDVDRAQCVAALRQR